MYILVEQGSTVEDGRMSADVMARALCRQMTWGMVFWMECVMERKLLHSPSNQIFFKRKYAASTPKELCLLLWKKSQSLHEFVVYNQ